MRSEPGDPTLGALETADDELLSVSAAARLLGVSPSSLRAWAAAGRVPHHRTEGGHRRFEMRALVDWLEARGGGPPAPRSGPQELIPTRIDPLPAVAALLRRESNVVIESFEQELRRTRPGAASRASTSRRTRVGETIQILADALEAGDLAEPYRDAEWEGYRYGAIGQPGDVPVTEVLALRRALDRFVSARNADEPGNRTLQRALDRVVVRVASGYAEGVQRRLLAQQEGQ
jgi:excisionase family DNA binding protein